MKLVAGRYHLSHVLGVTAAVRPEDVKISAQSRMVTDRLIAADELHIPALALSAVAENLAPLIPAVPITMLFPAMPGEQHQERMLRWRTYAALPLPAELRVQIPPAIDSPRFEHLAIVKPAITQRPPGAAPAGVGSLGPGRAARSDRRKRAPSFRGCTLPAMPPWNRLAL
jgi:hypothetical protein